jgi:molecular chaperone GrpE
MSPDDEKEPTIRVVDRRWWARGETTPPDSDAPSLKPTVVEDLEQRLADAANQLQAFIADHRRSLEEFEQVKARMRRDAAKEVERGKRQVLAEFLEVVDNLDRAIAASRSSAPDHASAAPASADQVGDNLEQVARGVQLVRDQFLAKLEAFGVIRTPALGERFDAVRHEAISTAPGASPDDDGVVVAVVKEGYAIGDDLLRPASVVVGTYGQR